MKPDKRDIEILVLSDIHLGTYGCHAKELYKYLKSISPQKVILNGDIIDIWQFSKRYWPKSHMRVLKQFIAWMSQGIEVVYIPGNHDEMMRRFKGFELGSFRIENKLSLKLPDGKAWVFHGDVFDVTMKYSKWLAKAGAVGYDSLIQINRLVNFISNRVFGKGNLSLSKKIKNSVKSAVKFINDFEETATGIAAENGYAYVVCGHIHQPIIRDYSTPNGTVTYLNSGDWIENLTSLEYNGGKWEIYQYDINAKEEEEVNEIEVRSSKELFDELVTEFKLVV